MSQKPGFRQRILQFMQGRYGVDQLSNCLIWLGILIAILTIFVHVRVCMVLSWMCIIYAYVRIFSKNIQKRYIQNQKFMDATWGIRNTIAKIRYRIKYGREKMETHHIYRCKRCGQKIRIPKGKGKIMITCPNCKYQFKKRS